MKKTKKYHKMGKTEYRIRLRDVGVLNAKNVVINCNPYKKHHKLGKVEYRIRLRDVTPSKKHHKLGKVEYRIRLRDVDSIKNLELSYYIW